MRNPAVLVIDLGTTQLKVGLFDFCCRSIDRICRTHKTAHLNVSDAAERLWQLVADGVRALMARNVHEIAAISLTGFMHYAVPLDAAGVVIPFAVETARVRHWFNCMLDHFDAAGIYAITGSRLDVRSVPPQLLCWRERDPEQFERISMLLPVKDYIRYRLTGALATDEIDACGTMIYDIHRGGWNRDLASFCALDLRALPPVLHCTEIGGELCAPDLGLRCGIPVCTGGGDDIEILGSGAHEPGRICEHAGSTGSFLLPLEGPCTDPQRRLELYPGVAKGSWVLGASCSNVTRALDWFLARSAYNSGGAVDWARVSADLETAMHDFNADRPIFLPYLYGERAPLWNPDLSASWLNLRATHTQADLLYSVIEGACFTLRAILDVFDELDPGAGTVCSSGGLNRLNTGQLRAALYRRPVQLVRGHDPTSFAAAAIALCATGELRNPCEAVEWLDFEGAIDPAPALTAVLEERYSAFSSETRRQAECASMKMYT